MAEKEVKEEETVDEDFKDVKKANKKNPVLRVISIILWVLILAWLSRCYLRLLQGFSRGRSCILYF